MFGSEPRHTSHFIILYFDRRVRIAHQVIPEQINAVADMPRRRHERYLCHIERLSGNRSIQHPPVTMPDAIHAVQQMEYRERGPIRCEFRMPEEAALPREELLPRHIRLCGGTIAECMIVLEVLRTRAHYTTLSDQAVQRP